MATKQVTQNEMDLADKQFVAFKLHNTLFAVPILDVHTVENVGDITPVPKAKDYVMGLMNLRGEVIPILSLRKRLGYQEDKISHKSKIVVLRLEDDESVGVVVDEISHVLTLNSKDIESKPEVIGDVDTLFLKGIAKQDELIMILDTNQIVDEIIV